MTALLGALTMRMVHIIYGRGILGRFEGHGSRMTTDPSIFLFFYGNHIPRFRIPEFQGRPLIVSEEMSAYFANL